MDKNNELRIEAQDLNQQAFALIKAASFEKAKEKLDAAIDMEPMLMDSYKNYGDLYMALQNYEEAKNMYKKALLIEKKANSIFFMVTLALCRMMCILVWKTIILHYQQDSITKKCCSLWVWHTSI